MRSWRKTCRRTGGVYVAVLGTAMIVALLGMCALIGQRIQNRLVVASSDIRQAQLNASTAIELGLLTIKQNGSWRSQLDADSYLFTNKSTGTGSSCSLKVTDEPADPANATADRPIKLLGIGYHGPATGAAPRTAAEQRAELVIDPRRRPLDCLKQGSSAQPNWQNVFDYYKSAGTQLDATQMPSGNPPNGNFAQNPSMDSTPVNDPPDNWNLPAPGTGNGQLQLSTNERSGTYSLRVRNRQNALDGPSQSISSFLKPETSYSIQVWVQPVNYTPANWSFTFRIKALGSPALSPIILRANKGQQSNGWIPLSLTWTTPSWTGDLDYAWFTVSCDDVWVGPLIFGDWEHPDFYLDDFLIKEAPTGLFIYKQALGPGYNKLYANAPTNPNGLYWIDCGGQDLYIERSRIWGTLLVLNPGPNSRIDYGPINWSPCIPGYPALLVNGNFSIRATNHPLMEAENAQNYNPTGLPYNGIDDSDTSDQYDSQIRGLIGIAGVLTYKQTPQIKGRVIAGSVVNNGSPTITYVPDSLVNPPPGFWSYSYSRRAASTQKVVLP